MVCWVFGSAGSGLQADVPQQAAVAQPHRAAAAPQEAAPAQVGLVGVLQAIGSQSLSVQTTEGMQLLTVNGAALGNGSSAINQLQGRRQGGGVDAEHPGAQRGDEDRRRAAKPARAFTMWA